MRKVLEDLIFLGVAEEEFTVFGKTWTLKTLDSEEHLDATNATGDYDTLSRIYALKVEMLGRALKSVEGIKLKDKEESLSLVRKLQPAVVNKLYEKYEELQKQRSDSLNELDEVKN